MNENNHPISSGTKHSEKSTTNSRFGSGYFSRIIADAARGLKIDQDINSNQSLIDSLEQDDQVITQKIPSESLPNKKPLASNSNSEDASNIQQIKAAQNSLKPERKFSPLQVREKFNSDVSAIKHNSESRVFSQHEKAADLQPKSRSSQMQSNTATTPVPTRNISDKVSTPFSTTPDNSAAKNTNKNTENFRRENPELSQNNFEKITKPIAVKNSAQAEKNQFIYSPKQEMQKESQAIQKIATRESIKNTHANVSSSSTNKSAAQQPKLHIGEVNIKVIDSAQDQYNNTNTRAAQKNTVTADTSKSAESRTFLRTL